MTPRDFLPLVITLVVAFCAGFWLKSSALAWLSVFAFIIALIRAGRGGHGDAEAFGYAIIAIILAWITFYFSTSQHWVGDLFGSFLKEFVLR